MKIYLLRLSFVLFSFFTAFAMHDDKDKSLKSTSFLMPTATITGSGMACENGNPVSISIRGLNGARPYTFIYRINNGPDETITSATNNDVVTVNAPTNTVGIFTYELISVSDQVINNVSITGQSAIVEISTNDISANFTFTDNICSGQPVQFNTAGTGSGTLSYLWDFGDGNSSVLQNPVHIFDAIGSTSPQIFNVTLTVTSTNGCASTEFNDVNIISEANLNITQVPGNPNGAFNNCNNASINYTINVSQTTTPTGYPATTVYTVDWGDGSPNSTNVSFPISHTYADLGVYEMVVTAPSVSGLCDASQSFQVLNISNPSGGINSPGSTTNICAPSGVLDFSISNWGTNSLDTIYRIDFGDGERVTYTQAQLIGGSASLTTPFIVPHEYLETSCPGQYFVILEIENLCSLTTGQVGPISVISETVADFTTVNSDCINSEVIFFNTSEVGFGTNCSTNVIYKWDYGDGTPPVEQASSSALNGAHTYTTPGTYSVTLSTNSSCGMDTITRQICIETPVVPAIAFDTLEGCGPLQVTTTNTTSTTDFCNPITYSWDVTYQNTYCGSLPENWSYVNSTSMSSEAPVFNFVTPGIYTIQATISGNSCGDVTTVPQEIIVKKPPEVVINTINDLCQAGATNTISVSSMVDSCAPASSLVNYSWSFPGGLPATSTDQNPTNITYATPGAYTVELTVNNECGLTTATSVNFTVFPATQITGNLNSCQGDTTQLSASTAGSNWSSNDTLIATVDNTGLVSSIGGGVVDITFTDDNGCQDTVSFDIVPSPIINNQPLVYQENCLGGLNTGLSFNISSGGGTLTYQWYSNTTNSTAGGTLIPGAIMDTYSPPSTSLGTLFYYCEIFFSQGSCASVLTQPAEVQILPLATMTSQPLDTQEICVGGVIDPLTASAMDGAGNITYQWFSNTMNSNTGGTAIPAANQSTYTPPAFTASGTFYFYVMISFDGNGCGSISSDVAEVIVVDQPIYTIQPIVSQTQCQNSPADLLIISVSGGLGTLSYQWFSTAVNSNTGGTIIPGETTDQYTPDTSVVGTLFYYCQVSQTGLGCDTTSDTAEVIVSPAPLISAQPVDSNICIGDPVTLLEVNVQNGVANPNFQWFSNTTDNTVGGTAITGATNNTYQPSSTNLGTVFYYCEVSFNSGGCPLIVSTTAEVIVSDFPAITDQNYTICTTDIFTMDPNIDPANTVPTNTLYTWTIVSNTPFGIVNGATNESTPQSVFTQSLTNSTTQIGTVVYNVTPIAGVCGGNSFNVTIDVFPTPIVNFDISDQTICNASSTDLVTLTTTIAGNVSYAWTANIPFGVTGVTTTGTNTIPIQTIVNSTTSPQTVTYSANATFTTGGSSCIGPPTIYTIIVNPEITTSSILSDYNGFNVSSFGLSDGSIDLEVIGGSGTYTYNWSGPNSFTAITQDLNNIEAGMYQVTINDGQCPAIILDFTLIEPAELLFEEDLSAHVDLECFGDSNGEIGVLITQPSVAPFSYEIVDSSNTVIAAINSSSNLNETLTGLSAGIYTVRITDNNGGIKELAGIEITQPDQILITAVQTDISCYGADDASITLTASGGNGGPFTALWSNLATGFAQANLGAGNYDITVTDQLGCTEIINLIIPEAPIFEITPVVNNISCAGANDASIALNLVGGLAPINLTWNDGSTSGTDRNNLGPGTYTVTIEDATPCIIIETFTIIEPLPLVIDAAVTDALECDLTDSGSINLLVSGGTSPFVYQWSNGDTTEDLNNITSGNYFVTVTDSQGCSASNSFTVIRPSPLNLSVIDTLEVDCETNLVSQNFEANVSGGVPPFTFNWSDGTTGGVNNEFMSTSQNGLIILTAIDSRGCTTNFNFDVELDRVGDPSHDTSSIAFITMGEFSILDPIQFNNTSTGDILSVGWDFGDGSFSNDLDPIHTYVTAGQYTITQTVLYPYGCTKTFVSTLFITKGYKLIMPSAFTPNEDALNDSFRPVQEGLENMRLDIYDTWGSLIFSESGDIIAGWDGFLNDREAENGNYYYKLTAKTFYGETINAQGPFIKID